MATPDRLLFVCTGNVYRSAMAEGFARMVIATRQLDCAVTSAGTLESERPIAPAAVRALGPAADFMATHTSRQLQEADVSTADLVLGMAREHVREVVVLRPDAWERSFTLKELLRRAVQIGPRPPDVPLRRWLGRAGAGRRSTELLGASIEDDVLDPLGASPAVIRRTAAEIRSAVETLFDLAWPPAC